MRAAQIEAPEEARVTDVQEPSPASGDVVIKVAAAGICGTDIHIKHDSYPYWPPVIMGHEFSGVIVEVGPGVTGYQVGDRVVAEPHTLACGRCELCRTANIQLCAAKRSPGWGIHGAFARYLAMPLQSWERAFEAIESKRGLKALLVP